MTVDEHRIEFTRPLYYPKQRAAVFDPARYSVIEASTKAGKTSACIGWLLEQALAGKPGWNYWWIAPVSDQALIAFNRMRRALPRGTFTTNLTLRAITLVTGTVIWFKSGDKPDSLYGEDVYAAVIDEASRTKPECWHAVRTTLTATRGPIRIIGNVRGRKNWAYRLARRAEQGRDPELAYHRLIAADAVAAGVLDEAEIEDARRLLPAHIFEELYEARASDDGGNPFGEQHIRACVAPMSNGQPIVWGWDLAKRQDFTVGIALDAEGAACRFERFQRIPWDEIMRRITSATRGAPALVDSTGLGDPVLGLLQKTPGSRFEGYHFHQTSKQKLMEGLAVAIQSRTVTFPDGPIALELSQFEYQYTRTGCTYGAPEGFHDDCVVALALAVEHKAHARRPLVISDRVLERIRMYPRRPGRWPCRMPSLGA